jgi:hypothetical protein
MFVCSAARVLGNTKGLRLSRKPLKTGWSGGIRTPDPVVNSHLLYRLSYTPMSAANIQPPAVRARLSPSGPTGDERVLDP